MPEGHVIHRLAAGLTQRFARQAVRVTSPQGRFAAAAGLIDGKVLTGAEAVGKQLLIDFENDRTIWIHLGLIGRLSFGPAGQPASPQTLRLRIASGHAVADLRGPQWCRLIEAAERAQVMARSGPDPLRADASPEIAWQRIARTGRPLAALLMDQACFAGVGNIFRAEVLFRHRIDPLLPARELPRAVFESVWVDLVALMRQAVDRGRIDTVVAAHTPEAMGRAPRADAHGGEVYVYRRGGLPCLVGGTEVQQADRAGRNLFWGPACQPPGSTGIVRC